MPDADVDVDRTRLYGSEDAEVLFFDIADVYETDIEPWVDEHDRRPRTIEEYTVHPAEYHLPAADDIVEHVIEWIADNDVTEGVFDGWETASKHEDVQQAFRDALNLLASKVTGRMADKLVATHTITWDDHGAPLVDGEPLYRKSADA